MKVYVLVMKGKRCYSKPFQTFKAIQKKKKPGSAVNEYAFGSLTFGCANGIINSINLL